MGMGAAALVAAACSSKSHPAAGSSTSTTGAVQRGGQLKIGISAETLGWDPTKAGWSQNGWNVARSFYDPLFTMAADGTAKPYLAAAAIPNPEYTTWTIRLRPNITFHDGTPLNAQALKTYLDAARTAPLNLLTLKTIAGTAIVDPLSVAVSMTSPWVAFPAYLSGALGYLPSPASLTGNTAMKQPVGTGPFIFKEWVSGDHLTVTRNPNYWRPGLPHLDQITWRPITNDATRVASLESGDIDIATALTPADLVHLRSVSGISTMTDANLGMPAVQLVILNAAIPPFNDVRARQALAYGTDQQRYNSLANNGVPATMRQFFLPSSPYYAPSGYPSYDPAKAKSLVAAYNADHGPLSFTMVATSVSTTTEPIQILQSMWKDIGANVQLQQQEQTTFQLNMLQGHDQAIFILALSPGGAVDPDQYYIYWSPTTIAPPGTTSVNFAHYSSPVLLKNTAIGRSNPDQAARVQAYKEIQRDLGANVPYVFLNQSLSIVGVRNRVKGLANPTLPDGGAAHPIALDAIWPTQASVTS
jgi:ABC-type transport system substrate-binding protein